MATDTQREVRGTPREDRKHRHLSERQRRVYEYVRDTEPVDRERLVRRAGSVTERRAVVHHCAALKRLGMLADDGDRLRIGFDIETLSDPEPVAVGAADVAVAIRPVGWGEYSDLCELLRRGGAEDADVEAERIARRVAAEGRLFRQDRVRERVVYAAYTAGEIRGWVLLSSSRPRRGHTVTLTSGVAGDGEGGADLESRLREYGLDWARSRGYGKVSRSLPATKERTIEILEAEGWTLDARLEGRYWTESGPVDEVVLARRFDGESES